MVKPSVVLAFAAALLGSAAAQAVTTVVSAVLDQPYVLPGPSDRNPTFYTQYLTPRFGFNVGDTLDVTLTFPGGMPLNLGFLPYGALFTVANGGGGSGIIYQSTATFSFINPVGAVYPTTGPQTGIFERNPAVSFTGLRQSQRGPLTFDGIHVIIRLDSAFRPDGPPGPVPMVTDTAFSVTFSNDVPEPATWATLIIGFAMTGTAARWRRAAA